MTAIRCRRAKLPVLSEDRDWMWDGGGRAMVVRVMVVSCDGIGYVGRGGRLKGGGLVAHRCRLEAYSREEDECGLWVKVVRRWG